MDDNQQNHREKLKNLSKLISGLRWSYGYTIEEVSEETGLHRNTLYRLENNNGNGCNITTILKLAELFDVHPSQLLLDI